MNSRLDQYLENTTNTIIIRLIRLKQGEASAQAQDPRRLPQAHLGQAHLWCFTSDFDLDSPLKPSTASALHGASARDTLQGDGARSPSSRRGLDLPISEIWEPHASRKLVSKYDPIFKNAPCSPTIWEKHYFGDIFFQYYQRRFFSNIFSIYCHVHSGRNKAIRHVAAKILYHTNLYFQVHIEVARSGF
ncbi:hypothetical protein T492DRAFT_433306 [Pavlovales sp. CCMP2436]|nr:hypothetical protein T492DRAFT_433306 [Pavlovales sp. CCMP2436]